MYYMLLKPDELVKDLNQITYRIVCIALLTEPALAELGFYVFFWFHIVVKLTPLRLQVI